MRIDHHISLLEKARTLLLKQQIGECVRQGDRVLDAGTGSGVLAVWAAKCGAGEVVAVDREHTGLARELARENGVEDIVSFIDADLSCWEPERQFDGMCAMLYENDPRRDEEAMRITGRLIQRAVKPGGWTIPNRVMYKARIVEWPEQDYQARLQKHMARISALERQLDLKMDSIRSRVQNALMTDLFPERGEGGLLPSNRNLGEDECAMAVDYKEPEPAYPERISLSIGRPGKANAVIWTQQLMCDELLLFANESISWFKAPLPVQGGAVASFPLDDGWRRCNVLDPVLEQGGKR